MEPSRFLGARVHIIQPPNTYCVLASLVWAGSVLLPHALGDPRVRAGSGTVLPILLLIRRAHRSCGGSTCRGRDAADGVWSTAIRERA